MSKSYDKIQNKLKSIGITPKSLEKHSESEVKAIEQKYNIILPDEYKIFLMDFGEVAFENDVNYSPAKDYPWTTNESNEKIVNFYGLESNQFSLQKAIETYIERMPSSVIPIAECPNGNQICICVCGQNYGEIYLWDHEQELEAFKMLYPDKDYPSIDEYWDNLYFTAQSFLDFINSFYIADTETPKEILDDIEVWLNDDLLNPNTIEEKLKILSYKHGVAFCASCCERLLPNYKKFVDTEHWGDYAFFRETLNEIWNHIIKSNLSEKRINELMCNCFNVIPDSEDFESVYASYAIDAGAGVYNTLKYCLDENVKDLITVSTVSINTVDLFIQEKYKLNSIDPQFEQTILENSFMQTELKKQFDDLELLCSTQIITESFITDFRSSVEGRSNIKI